MILRSTLIWFFLLSAANAQPGGTYPLDSWLQACIERDSTTTGMNNCTHAAERRWDKEMNRVYANLISRLPADQGRALQQAQLGWIKFRDLEIQFGGNYYGSKDGTIWSNIRAGGSLNLTRWRTLELMAYAKTLDL